MFNLYIIYMIMGLNGYVIYKYWYMYWYKGFDI